MPIESSDTRRPTQPVGGLDKQAGRAVSVRAAPSPFAVAGAMATEGASRPALSGLDDAHRTALSALRNDRFREVLERLTDVRSSNALTVMRPAEGAGTDVRSALARYQENS